MLYYLDERAAEDSLLFRHSSIGIEGHTLTLGDTPPPELRMRTGLGGRR
jgi:hypothetical protein